MAALAGCSDEEEDTLQIGAILSTTGALAEAGVTQLQAAILAAEEINAAGGVLGKELRIVLRNDGTDPAKARVAAGAIAEQEVPVVLGTVGSSLTLEAAKTLIPGTVVISGSATSPALTTFADGGFLFRTCASEVGLAKLLAARARAAHTRVAIIHPPGADERGVADAFEAAFVAAGGQVVARVAYEEGQASYAALLNEVLAARPEAVLLDANPLDGAGIIREFATGFSREQLAWFFTDGLEDDSFVAAVGQSFFSFEHQGVGPGTPTGVRSTRFRDAYRARFGEEPPRGTYAANLYDAVYLAALAMESAGAPEAAAIRDALPAVSLGGTVFGPADFAAAVAAVKAGGDINYEGASGSVDLNAQGDTFAPYDIWAVRDGAISVIERAVQAPP